MIDPNAIKSPPLSQILSSRLAMRDTTNGRDEIKRNAIQRRANKGRNLSKDVLPPSNSTIADNDVGGDS